MMCLQRPRQFPIQKLMRYQESTIRTIKFEMRSYLHSFVALSIRVDHGQRVLKSGVSDSALFADQLRNGFDHLENDRDTLVSIQNYSFCTNYLRGAFKPHLIESQHTKHVIQSYKR